MTPATSKRGKSLDAAPIIKEPKLVEKSLRPTSKQTVEIGRKAIGQIKRICTAKGLSFQDFAIYALNLALQEAGEPSIEEMEAEE